MYWMVDRLGCDVINEYSVHELLVADHIDHHTFDLLDIRDLLLRVVSLCGYGI